MISNLFFHIAFLLAFDRLDSKHFHPHLLVQFLNAFDQAMNLLDDKFSFLASSKQIVSWAGEEDKVNTPSKPEILNLFRPN